MLISENFSRFIRPGSVRVNTTGENISINDPLGLMVSSYLHAASKKLITVLINYGFADITTEIKVKGYNITDFYPYLTSSETKEGLQPQPLIKSGNKISIPKRSIVTLAAAIPN